MRFKQRQNIYKMSSLDIMVKWRYFGGASVEIGNKKF